MEPQTLTEWRVDTGYWQELRQYPISARAAIDELELGSRAQKALLAEEFCATPLTLVPLLCMRGYRP
jgi:hypothetical protein